VIDFWVDGGCHAKPWVRGSEKAEGASYIAVRVWHRADMIPRGVVMVVSVLILVYML
jgi:hypothetical protein